MLNLLEACRRFPVKKFLFASTGGAIYGDTDRLPTPEDHPPQPLSPYGIHKWLGEQYLRYYAHQHGLSYTVLRYANVYGPRQNPDGEAGVVSIFLTRLLGGRPATLFAYPGEEDGMVRDYVYVEDVARANLEAAGKGTGETINIGTGVGTTTGALYRAIAEGFPGAPEARRERGPARGPAPEPAGRAQGREAVGLEAAGEPARGARPHGRVFSEPFRLLKKGGPMPSVREQELVCPTCGRARKPPECHGRSMELDGGVFFCPTCAREQRDAAVLQRPHAPEGQGAGHPRELFQKL